jgi:hypothetical protein
MIPKSQRIVSLKFLPIFDSFRQNRLKYRSKLAHKFFYPLPKRTSLPRISP